MIEVSIQDPIARATGKDPISGKVRIEFICPKRPFLFWSSYAIGEQVQYPKGYGVAYREWDCDRLLFAPMPFNIIIGWLVEQDLQHGGGVITGYWKYKPSKGGKK